MHRYEMAEIYKKVIKFSINLIFPYCAYCFNVGEWHDPSPFLPFKLFYIYLFYSQIPSFVPANPFSSV